MYSIMIGLTPPHFCAHSMPAPGLPMPHVVVFCIFNKLRLEKLVHLV